MLVVEDEVDLVVTYERILRREGYRVVSAGSREAGLAALEAEQPGLLIADLRLPDGDGLDVVRAARARATPTLVIVVTAFVSNARREAALAAGASAVLAKPFSTDVLMKLIQSVLGVASHDPSTVGGDQPVRVRELMARQVVTVVESDSCRDAVERMYRARIHHLPVVSREGMLVGVVTDRDLRHYFFSSRVHDKLGAVAVDEVLRGVPVGEIMSAPAITASSDDDLLAAARVMLKTKVGSLPVVDGGRVVGIITETDVLRRICRADPDCSPEVAEIVVSHR